VDAFCGVLVVEAHSTTILRVKVIFLGKDNANFARVRRGVVEIRVNILFYCSRRGTWKKVRDEPFS
jgi:hypothetical protein